MNHSYNYNKPKVSVIIPSYNVEKYIVKALESVINQTFKDIEIICVDDGSTDKTLTIIEKYQSKDKRIKIISQNHCGQSAARNTGIEHAKGDYIVFVDSDDYIELNCIELTFNKIERNSADIVIYGYNYATKSGYVRNETCYQILSHFENCTIHNEDLIRINDVVWNKMYKKEFLISNGISFNTELTACEDVVFNYICSCHSPKYVCMPEVLYNYLKYRKHSIMSKGMIVLKTHIDAFKYFLNTKEYINSDEESKLRFIDSFLGMIVNYISSKRYKIYHLLYFYQATKFFKEINRLIDKNLLNKSIFIYNIQNSSFKKYLIRHIFSVENEYSFLYKHKNLMFLGIKISIKLGNIKSQIYTNFKNSTINDKTVLVVEVNPCHGETLPGFIKYFNALGYKVDILCSKEIAEENPFCYVPRSYYQNLYPASLPEMAKIFASKKLKEYDYIFFNSYHLYYNQKSKYELFSIPETFDKITEPKHSFIYLSHHLESLDNDLCKNKRILKLIDIKNEAIYCNSCYYGNVNIYPQNDIVQFIVVGALDSQRKNSDELFNAVRKLIQNNITNFKVKLIGAKTLTVPCDLEEYIEYLGRLPFKEMYDNVKESDYILALLDPCNPEHERYIKYGATGTIQLSYGFVKPLVVHEKFAKTYKLNENNAIVYNDNLRSAMELCINIPTNKYQELCENLQNTRMNIEQLSLKNLQEVMRCNI